MHAVALPTLASALAAAAQPHSAVGGSRQLQGVFTADSSPGPCSMVAGSDGNSSRQRSRVGAGVSLSCMRPRQPLVARAPAQSAQATCEH